MNPTDFSLRRQAMVQQIAARGVHQPKVLDALLAVPREEFLPDRLRDRAYEDVALQLPQGGVLQRPWLLALLLAALELRGDEKVLEVGSGCGYASALLAQAARDVYAVETDGRLAEMAAAQAARQRLQRVHQRHAEAGDGWPEEAPFDAIVVHPGVALAHLDALREQLAVGGCLVMVVPSDARVSELVRVRRISELQYQQQDLADLRLDERPGAAAAAASTTAAVAALAVAVAQAGEAFADLEQADLEPLLRRIGQARVVLIGESTHGSSEFYRMRQRITRALIERRGFDFVAIESDWPDAARIDDYVRQAETAAARWSAFARFPAWMWRNREVAEFVDWLRSFNAQLAAPRRVAVHGLDLYSMHRSIERVLEYLDQVDPESAQLARQRYGCLSPWEADASGYAHAWHAPGYRSCEQEVVAMLRDLLRKERDYGAADGDRFLDALQNARLVANAERYYRTMYYGSRQAWNLRDGHMFETLRTLLDFHGPHSRAVVWAHNSHIGDSAATEMGKRGECNIGRLCRQEFAEGAYSIGLGTHAGEVAAAPNWDAPMQVMRLRPSLASSYERIFHDSGVPGMLLPLRRITPAGALGGLLQARLQRAVGVVYRPHSELASHYFDSVLPWQYDEYLWIDSSHAVTPIDSAPLAGTPETYPFGV